MGTIDWKKTIKQSTFQQRFKELFEESGKTITELSKELHVSNQTISAWKTGARSPKEPTILTIAKYFNVDVRWLMGFDVAKEPNQTQIIRIKASEKDQRLTELFERARLMSATDIDLLIAMADRIIGRDQK